MLSSCLISLLLESSPSWRDAGADLGAGERMTVADGLLLALSIVMFVYLGFALFKAERF
jgi:K+-transporting ATPase KdpF subunit